MLVSCVVHTALFILLALVYVASHQPRPHLVVLQAAIAGAEEVSLQFTELPSVEPAGDELPTPSATPSTQEFDLNINAQLAQTQHTVNATLTSALAATEKNVGSTGGVDGAASGKALGESLSKLGANFFGSYAQGERFVFVLDSSRSMTGDRWIYACQELMDSVDRLEPHQSFYVICFDDKTTCMFNMSPKLAKYYKNDDATRRQLRRWLSTKKLGPGTFPATAMAMALEMHPDAIFLLSDGELRDDTLQRLRVINGFSTERHQVPVHTVHLMSIDGRDTLSLIAFENVGTFTPVQGSGGF